MEKQASTAKTEPIIIEQAGMRMTIAHRQGLGGSDEGLTFDITTAGEEGKRILRYDCFYKNPHYHVGASGGEQAAYKMKDEGVEDSVRWTWRSSRAGCPRWSSKPDTRKSPGRSISRQLPIGSTNWSRRSSPSTDQNWLWP
jgi:hypothetical protein